MNIGQPIKKELTWSVTPYTDPYTGERGYTLWNRFECYSDGFYTSKQEAQKWAKEWNKDI